MISFQYLLFDALIKLIKIKSKPREFFFQLFIYTSVCKRGSVTAGQKSCLLKVLYHPDARKDGRQVCRDEVVIIRTREKMADRFAEMKLLSYISNRENAMICRLKF